MPLKSLQLDTIRLDGQCQPPGRLGEEEVADYAEQMKDGRWDFDRAVEPITVFEDGGDRWLAHGFHRYHAARRAGLATVECLVRSGTLAEAQEFAAGCNKMSSRRRSNADKQWAVDTVLRLHADWSDHRISEHVGVSHTMIASRRPNRQSLPVETRVGADGKTRKVPQRGAKFHNPNPVSSEPPPAPPMEASCQIGKSSGSSSDVSSQSKSSAPPSSPSAATDPATEATSRAHEIKAFANEITAFKKRIHDAFDKDPLGAYLNWNYLDTQISNIRQAITHAMPHAACPNQPNCAAGRCTMCKGRGWLNETDFKIAEQTLGNVA